MAPPRLTRSRGEVEGFLDEQVAKGIEFLREESSLSIALAFGTGDAERWAAYTKEGLSTFYSDEEPAEEFHAAITVGLMEPIGMDRDERLESLRGAIQRGINTLNSLKDRLDFAVPASEGPIQQEPPERAITSRNVFVVHGPDLGLRDRVARVLGKLQLEPIILQEQPSAGRTVIEKFEDHSEDAAFAVVILSADDWARGPDETEWPGNPNRARQNVILELGYFMGRLGRRYVAPLLGPGVEQPSDTTGIGYISLKESDWPFRLGAELAAAGIDVDLNLLQ
jgi:predicted nucleotide-binding protein